MADDAARLLQAVEKLPLGYLKVTLLLLLNTGMRPEKMLAIRVGNITSDGNETIISITGALNRDGKTIKDYPKSDAGRRSLPVDDYTADTMRAWIEVKLKKMKELGLKPSMSMLVCGPESIPRTYQSWHRDWLKFVADADFEGVRPLCPAPHRRYLEPRQRREPQDRGGVDGTRELRVYARSLCRLRPQHKHRYRHALHELPSGCRLGRCSWGFPEMTE